MSEGTGALTRLLPYLESLRVSRVCCGQEIFRILNGQDDAVTRIMTRIMPRILLSVNTEFATVFSRGGVIIFLV
jgi:hypothetical protein